MMKKKWFLSFICSLTALFALGGFASCGDKGNNSTSEPPFSATDTESNTGTDTGSEEKTAVISGVPEKFEFKLSEIDDEAKAAAYYLNGVTATAGGAETTANVDLSQVDFTSAGEYEIVYSVEGYQERVSSVIRIYGLPTITAEENVSVDWCMMADETAFAEKIKPLVSAKDSFDNAVEVAVSGEWQKNAYGFYDAGSYKVVLTATDVVGNVATKEVTLTMTKGTAPTIENVSFDLSNVAVALTDYEVFVDFEIYAVHEGALTALTNKDIGYDATIGGSVFTPDYARTLALAVETEFIVVVGNAYTTVKAAVTDNQAPAFTYPEVSSFTYLVGEEFALPQALKNTNSAQAIEVKYTLDGAEYTVPPTEAGEYTYAIAFYRGEEKIAEKEYGVVLVTNYGWSAKGVKATADGNIAITGATGDVNAVLSASYIAAHGGACNTVVIKTRILQESSNQADVNEATGPSIWWIEGSTYALENKEQYYGISKDKVATGAENTFTLRVEADGSATFILRNFDGWLEITEIEFLTLDPQTAAQQKLNTGFPGWAYIHHNDPNAYVDGKTYHIKGGNFTLTNLLISDAIAAGYKYATLRVKMTNTTTPIEEIYFITKGAGYGWDHYWNSFVGNEVVVRFDMSKYFESTDLANSDNIIVQFFGRYIGGNDIDAENIEVELIGFETAEATDFLVSVPMGDNYTVTGATYAKAVDGIATFAISANENYAISSVAANGDAVVTDNGDGTYTVSNITQDTYLKVETRKTAYSVTIAESDMYIADVYGATVKEGESFTFTLTANEGFEINGVSADNASVTDNGNGTYTVSNLTAETVITVIAQATKSSYVITLAENENYTASFTQVEVGKAEEYTFTVTAKEGYFISDVTADNASITKGVNGSYTLTNIVNDTTVSVTAVKQVALGETMMSSEADFYNYFHFGAWGTNTWDGTSVNVTTGNIQVQKAFIDDALAQGYTHAKISVSSASSDVASVAMITDGSLGWNYYWKSYNGNSADVRIDLSAYVGKDYSTLTIEFRNSEGTATSSSVTVTGIEFFQSEETTAWTKTSTSIYAAYENGKLVIDMLGAGGNPSGVSTTTEWWKQYSGACSNAAIRLYTEYLYRNNNSRAPLWGKNGSAVDVLYGNSSGDTANSGWRWLNDQNYSDGDTFFFTADTESVFTVEMVDWVSTHNEWSGTSVTEVNENTVKVTALNGQKLFFAQYASYVAAGYTSVTVSATYASGDLWVGNDVWGDSGYMHSLANGASVTLDLTKMDKLCLFFNAAMSDVEITWTFNK